MFSWKNRKGNMNQAQEEISAALELSRPDNKMELLGLLKHNEKIIVDKLSLKVEETSFSTVNLIGIINNISKNIEIQINSIEKVSNEINSYSALAEEVSASTSYSQQTAVQTLETAREGSEAVNNSIRAMNEIEKSVSYVKDVVNNLNGKASHINEMLKIIKDISEQTNLLSLNASIEAARAGEAGRGFAVVASEVKKLAQKSSESAEKISKTIDEINQSIKQTIEAMNTSNYKVREGVEIANNTVGVFNKIIDAVNTTTSVTKEINNAVSEQTQSLENIVTSTQNMTRTSEKVMMMVESASMNAEDTRTSLEVLSEVTKDLRGITGELLDKIESRKDRELILKTCTGGSPSGFDPAMAFDQQSAKIFINNHAGLLLPGLSTDILPGVAKSWYVDDDNATWFFNIRKGARFHNGREIAADDVKYSLERVLSPRLKSPNAWFLSLVEGAEEFQNGKAKTVTGIKVLDKYRMAIKLSVPYSGFLLNLAQSCCAIMAEEDVEKGKYTGCGPYVIENMYDDKCVMRSFKDYFGGQPYVDKIEVVYEDSSLAESFTSGQYDFITIDNKAVLEKIKETDFAKKIKMQNVMTTTYGGFNLESNSIFARDEDVRRAINYAVNKKRIIDAVMGGMAEESKGPVPPSIIDNGYLKSFEYNPERAKEILRRKGINKINEKLIILAREGNSGSTNDRTIELIISDLKEIGIQCDILRVPAEKYLTHESISKCHMFLSGWVADTGDPDNYLEPLFNQGNYTNFTGYVNENVTELMNKARSVINPQKRTDMYKEIQNIIINDVPWLFLYHPKTGYVSRDGIIGVRVSSLGKIKFEDIIMEK